MAVNAPADRAESAERVYKWDAKFSSAANYWWYVLDSADTVKIRLPLNPYTRR